MPHAIPITNPHATHRSSPGALLGSIAAHRQLIARMVRREVVGRYRGSALGLAWSFFNPVLMLAIYTLVFAGIFKARWNITDGPESTGQFAIVMFVGMIVLNLFTEVLNSSPTLILANANFVKKVVFPLEILPIISIGAALFHMAASVGVLVLAILLMNGTVPWTGVLLPVVIVPLVLLALGVSWVLASLGVYLRDVAHGVGLASSALMFLSPVFYPLSAVPETFRPLIAANPLTFIIEQARVLLIAGRLPDWSGLAIFTLASAAFAWAGFAWFQKTRKGFADVL
jgi:lipopolysaccharide transport system permease protein